MRVVASRAVRMKNSSLNSSYSPRRASGTRRMQMTVHVVSGKCNRFRISTCSVDESADSTPIPVSHFLSLYSWFSIRCNGWRPFVKVGNFIVFFLAPEFLFHSKIARVFACLNSVVVDHERDKMNGRRRMRNGKGRGGERRRRGGGGGGATFYPWEHCLCSCLYNTNNIANSVRKGSLLSLSGSRWLSVQIILSRWCYHSSELWRSYLVSNNC